MLKKAIVLLSGGLDSTTCLAIAKHQGFDCTALSFDYGQKHAAELNAAKKIAAAFGVSGHYIMPLPTLGGSALTDAAIVVPDHNQNTPGQIPITYVPARNTVFLSIALGLAEILAAEAIFIGVNAVDYSNYPDCRPEYIATFQHLAQLGTEVGVEHTPIKIEAPLLHWDKKEIIQQGHALGVNYALTVSCYRANEAGLACGSCDSCVFRKKGFAEAGIDDPTPYIE